LLEHKLPQPLVLAVPPILTLAHDGLLKDKAAVVSRTAVVLGTAVVGVAAMVGSVALVKSLLLAEGLAGLRVEGLRWGARVKAKVAVQSRTTVHGEHAARREPSLPRMSRAMLGKKGKQNHGIVSYSREWRH